MKTNTKPRVTRTFLNGWKCSGHGVTGYGMSVANAYASWEQRRIRQQAELFVTEHLQCRSHLSWADLMAFIEEVLRDQSH